MSDLLLLGRTTIEEARSLLYWLETAEGYKKLGICGLSMGMWASTFCPLDRMFKYSLPSHIHLSTCCCAFECALHCAIFISGLYCPYFGCLS